MRTCLVAALLTLACARSGFERAPDAEGDVRDGDSVAGLDPRYFQKLWVADDHACMQRGTELWCWGNNDNDEFGFSTGGTAVATPVLTPFGGPGLMGGDARHYETCVVRAGDLVCSVRDDGPVTQLTSGVTGFSADHRAACALQHGQIKCWDDGNFLVSGPTPGTSAIDAAPFSAGVTVVRVGSALACALIDERMRCWGEGPYIGRGSDQADSAVPLPVAVPGEVVHFAVGADHACALLADGVVVCWGRNTDGQVVAGGDFYVEPTAIDLGVSGEVTAVAAFQRVSCALVDGGARCWGYNEWGTLGRAAVPFDAEAGPDWVDGLGPGAGVVEIDGDNYSVCARLADDEARCWGRAVAGRAGDGLPIRELSPVAVVGLPSGPFVMAEGSHHSGLHCAIAEGGDSTWCWGSNNHYQLNVPEVKDAYSVPQNIGLAVGVDAVAFTNEVVCVQTTGTVQSWGRAVPALGRDGPMFVLNPPGLVGGAEFEAGVTQVACGLEFCCAIGTGGEVWCWGESEVGALGNGGTPEASTAPQRVEDYTVTPLAGMTELRAGHGLACAWNATEAWCWGNNSGDVVCSPEGSAICPVTGGNELHRAAPLDLVGQQPFDVAPASGVICLIANGAVYCRGWGPYAGLGLAQVTGLPSPVHSIHGAYNAPWCVIAGATRQVWCWGWGPDGQLGSYPSMDDITTPVRIGSLENVESLASGSSVCAATATSVDCWGGNSFGQLGDGRPMLYTSPVPVAFP